MDNRECINCKIEMNEAWINTVAGVLILEEPIKVFKRKACGVTTYVCSSCEHVKFVAENKELFK
ncbi:hypothetical protein LGL08_00460 [Clostridium estertheticum]|uniref:hypothetical protein n=1 Tax=Clostridium estertheticum TaxID=238834 RepID=UPI001CF3FCA2|nr:hypothetical protein [Clostridium estertheticum]MCB2305686.1 hypothetical protein [Clostridium estertheticum]MCB2344499.1 hypothetical protein [Clostridium estertheticum]MCB2348041.1 hypothetical protein [Clostridium estertheticum]WAG45684.1 hypothetical protein LL127_19550 [Clostridium estertheticum]